MAPPEFGFYAGAMILTQDTTPSHTLTPLPVGIVYINNYPLNALFDTGSQVNTISPHIAKLLNLPLSPINSDWTLTMANRTIARPDYAVKQLVISIEADDQGDKFDVPFPSAALVLESPFDVILGTPFLNKWNLYIHHCNSTLVYLDKSGTPISICLRDTNNHKCRSYCPFSTSHTVQPSTRMINDIQHINEREKQRDKSLTTECAHQVMHIQSTDTTNKPVQSTINPIPIITFEEYLSCQNNHDVTTYLAIIKTTNVQQTDDVFSQQLQSYALEQFPSLFPEQLPSETPPKDRLQHPIDLYPNSKIPTRRLYRQTTSELEETKKQLQEYLSAGHIRPSTSAFGAPVLLVRKKDGSMRMCIDYRALNNITIKNCFPLPRIDDLHDRLGKARYFTKLDLYSGYHQIPIRQGDEHKTAFTSRYGTYEFLVMPFGLTNAPSTFQTAMNTLFHDWLDDFVIVYLDDILVYSPTQETHKQHVSKVLTRLQQHQWYCKLKKCDFAQTQVEYLGHFITNGTINIDPSKTQAMMDWPTPFKNLTEVQSFLGLVGYYRKFIRHFSHLAKPLYEFAHKNTPFEWKDKHTDAVNALKQAMISPDCLVIFDPERKTTLTTDACDYAMGACLTQTYDTGDRPIAFISKTFNDTEMKYTLWEKELYAVIWAVHQFRPYLLNTQFLIRSDNKPTTQIITNHSLRTTTTTTNRVNRWLLSLQAFNFKIEHHPGKSNVVADALSRYPICDKTKTTTCNAIVSTFDATLRQRLIELYPVHPSTAHLWKLLNDDTLHSRFQLIDKLICTRDDVPRVLIPNDTNFRFDLFKEIHDTKLAGHQGINKLLSFVSERYIGTQLRSDIHDYIKTCPECQKAKPRHDKPFGHIMPLPIAQSPWTDISMDLITQLPESDNSDAIFVVVDRFSKMAHFIPTTTTADAPALAQLFLTHIVRLHGFPKSIISDRDTRFVSVFWNEVWKTIGTTLRMSTANHPQTDGQTERTNRTLEQYLRIYTRHQQKKWKHHLPFAEFAYNNTTHAATGFAPFFVVYQRHVYCPIDVAISELPLRNANAEAMITTHSRLLEIVRKHLDTARIRMITQNQRFDKNSPFQVDDQVLIHRSAFRTFSSASHSQKFDDRWLGPFSILEIINHNAYKIDLPKSIKAHNVINISFLKPYKMSSRFKRTHPDNLLLPPVEQDDDDSIANATTTSSSADLSSNNEDVQDEYEVDNIIRCRLQRKYPRQQRNLPLQQQIRIQDDPSEYEYLVKWKGYPSYEATWEPLQNLQNAPNLFNNFVNEHHLPKTWNRQLANTGQDQDLAISMIKFLFPP